MKDFTINGKRARVFVLTSTDTRVVYIPVLGVEYVDYQRLVEMEKKSGRMPLLDYMNEHKLDNGINALELYQELIQVADIVNGDELRRIMKPSERELAGQAALMQSEQAPKATPEKVDSGLPKDDRGRDLKYKLTVNGQDYFWTGIGKPCREIVEYLAVDGQTKEDLLIIKG